MNARQTAAIVIAAAIVMAATLPGRTHGLGLITTRLLADFPELTESGFAKINLVATLVGSLMCLPCGSLIDRFGMRSIAVVVLGALGFVVLCMAGATSLMALCIAITLTRGIGQSMLSVVSLAVIGKSFPNRPGTVMGVYAVLLTFMMAAWTGLLGYRVTNLGWRIAWSEVGCGILILTPIVWSLLPKLKHLATPSAGHVNARNSPVADSKQPSATLWQALATPCFWVFALGISLFGMVSSGISLFQQSILESKGFSEGLYHSSLVLGLFVGMGANLLGGWLATRFPLQKLFGAAMWLLAGSLLAIPYLATPFQAYLFCCVYSFAGGFITVLFFTVWGQAFGTRELAKIQGAAQMLTVIGSSLGPILVTESNARFQSYDPILWCFALASILIGLFSFVIAIPRS